MQVSRGERYWLVYVPGIDRTTQARTLREVDAMARDLVAVMTGEAADSITLDVQVQLPRSVRAHLTKAERLRADSAAARSRAAAEARAAARELAASGMPMRDIGQVLGVSHQRAQQLVKAS